MAFAIELEAGIEEDMPDEAEEMAVCWDVVGWKMEAVPPAAVAVPVSVARTEEALEEIADNPEVTTGPGPRFDN